jgi:Tol biopolymer transport system component/DNA-binding winged helix-turn-helix (wHTH) protein
MLDYRHLRYFIMAAGGRTSQVVRFATFELDLQAGELRKGGVKLKLTGQPFQVLTILLEQPGAVVTREELQKRLWPDTFVDVDHNLNAAINKIRETLGDTAENPKFVETLPRRGYRFIAPLNGITPIAVVAEKPEEAPCASRSWVLLASAVIGAFVLVGAAGLWVYKRYEAPVVPPQRTLTRLTFEDGLQIEPTWSPDNRYIAYSSNRAGKFDIWVQAVSGGDPVQVTRGPGHHWQPDWSPDGKYIAYRSEEGDGGLFIVPALGGADSQRKVSPFGYYPHWSPDSSQILFQSEAIALLSNQYYTTGLDGNPPREILRDFEDQTQKAALFLAWHPDGKRVSMLTEGSTEGSGSIPDFWTVPIAGGAAVKSEAPSAIKDELARMAAENGQGELWLQNVGKSSFSWAPTGRAIYFDRAIRGAKNIWRMTVNPATLQIIGADRLTAGPGPDDGEAVSPNGKRLAFTTKTEHVRVWLMPFAATAGRIMGTGQPVTSSGTTAMEHMLSRDGSKLAFTALRGGKWELWEESLADRHEARVIADDYVRENARWSPDGTRLVYTHRKYEARGSTHDLVRFRPHRAAAH